MNYCEKHKVGLVGDVECDECVYEQRDRYKAALQRIANEPHTRLYLVDLAKDALNTANPITFVPPHCHPDHPYLR